MDILSICGVAIVATVLSVTISRHNRELSLLVSIGAAVVILLSVISYVINSVSAVSSILTSSGIKAEYILILLKVLGICFLTEFTCDCTKEAGLDSLCCNVSLAGKVLVLIASLPLFTEVLSVVTSLTGGAS